MSGTLFFEIARACSQECNKTRSLSALRQGELLLPIAEKILAADLDRYRVCSQYFIAGMPGLFEDIKTTLAAGPAVVNAGAAEAGGAPLKFGTTIVPAIRMVRLSTVPSVYTQELAEMVFGSDTLGRCCLRGSTVGSGKEVLEKNTVDDIIVHVLMKFPQLSESDVRAYLRRKCNNAATALKKNGGY